jgi:capsule polysaccharide modification protein KpsS
MLQFIDIVSDWAESTKTPAVFKLHPFNKGDSDIMRKVASRTRFSKYCFMRDGNIQEMLHKARGVWTVNSGVGFEGLIHRKPVVTHGDCDYKEATLNGETSTKQQIHDYIFNDTTDASGLRSKFIYFYMHRHAYWLKAEDKSQLEDRLGSFIKNQVGKK